MTSCTFLKEHVSCHVVGVCMPWWTQRGEFGSYGNNPRRHMVTQTEGWSWLHFEGIDDKID